MELQYKIEITNLHNSRPTHSETIYINIDLNRTIAALSANENNLILTITRDIINQYTAHTMNHINAKISMKRNDCKAYKEYQKIYEIENIDRLQSIKDVISMKPDDEFYNAQQTKMF